MDDLAVLVERGDDCRCCCCTGECRGTAPWQLEAEEREHAALAGGFKEGDLGGGRSRRPPGVPRRAPGDGGCPKYGVPRGGVVGRDYLLGSRGRMVYIHVV